MRQPVTDVVRDSPCSQAAPRIRAALSGCFSAAVGAISARASLVQTTRSLMHAWVVSVSAGGYQCLSDV